jgi:hypothetical protein
MKADEKRKERARNFVLKFKEPLSGKLLSDLSEERRFYTKYRRLFKSIRIGDEVIGLIVEDSLNINYLIDQAGITARSFVQSEDNVIKKLKLMGDRIIELFDLEKSSYEIIEGDDFRYLENSLLESWFKDVDIIKKIKREFEGEEEPQLIQIKFVIRNTDGNKLINFVHENAAKVDEKRLLIEANKEYLLRIIKAIGKDG